MIVSPFRFASYEPRFVIEDYNVASLHHAIALWRQLTFRDEAVTFAAAYPTALLLTGGDHPGPFHPWRPVSLARADVVAYILKWLDTAEVAEPRPNFDGTEAKGFCAFWGYFNSEELAHGYGSFIVTTKWFEIHK